MLPVKSSSQANISPVSHLSIMPSPSTRSWRSTGVDNDHSATEASNNPSNVSQRGRRRLVISLFFSSCLFVYKARGNAIIVFLVAYQSSHFKTRRKQQHFSHPLKLQELTISFTMHSSLVLLSALSLASITLAAPGAPGEAAGPPAPGAGQPPAPAEQQQPGAEGQPAGPAAPEKKEQEAPKAQKAGPDISAKLQADSAAKEEKPQAAEKSEKQGKPKGSGISIKLHPDGSGISITHEKSSDADGNQAAISARGLGFEEEDGLTIYGRDDMHTYFRRGMEHLLETRWAEAEAEAAAWAEAEAEAYPDPEAEAYEYDYYDF